MDEPLFLSLEIIEELHSGSLHNFGGIAGIRDRGMIESALGSAQNTFYYGRGDLFDVAAAYAYHIAEAQAFLDGNKRTACAAALTFLRGNGCRIQVDEMLIYDAMIAIANKQLDKAGLAALFRSLAQPGRSK